MIKTCKIKLTIGVVLFSIMTSTAFGQATINTVFFSEYIEGSDNNRALEIYNGSGSEVDLSEFSISISFDGGSIGFPYALNGSLSAGEVYVIGSAFADLAISSQANVRTYDRIVSFDGSDAIVLSHNRGIVDYIGGNTGDPGIGWDVAGTANATANHTLVRKQNITQGNATAEDSFGTTLDNSEWIVYDQDEFSYLGSHCNLPSQATSVTFGATGETSMVVNWTKGDGDKSLVVVKAGSAVDAVPVFGADYTSATTVFSPGMVTLGDNVVVYSGDASTVTVTGLTIGTTYYVAVYAYNTARFCYNTASPARDSKRTTTPNDEDSDITAVVGGETAAIDYQLYQDRSDLTMRNSASLFTFSINDKGQGTEALSTTVTAISFEITNHQYLRTLALFDGTADGAEFIKELRVARNTNTLSFTDLSIVATPRSSKKVNVRATFSGNVDDGEQIGLTISAVEANALGSLFAVGYGGGAATVSSNQIEVTATVLAITAPAQALVSADFDLTVTAVDDLGNTDVAARNVTLSRTTGTGNLTSATGLGAKAMDNGVYLWNDLRFDAAGTITVTVTDTPGTLSAISEEGIDVSELVTSVFFSEYIEGSDNNRALEIYNGSGSTVDLSQFSISIYRNGGLTTNAPYSLRGNLTEGEVYVIGGGSDPVISRERDINSLAASFTGNDAIALLHIGVIVDIIGNNDGIDPSTGWRVAGTAGATVDHTLVRKPRVTVGNPTPLASFTDDEWIVYDVDEFSYLGSHTQSPSCTIPSTQATNVTFGATEETSMVVNWTKGDGDKSLVVVKAGSEVDATLVLGTGYTSATADFSAGKVTLATDNVVVYSGDMETVTVTGLTSGVTYYVAVYAYNATGFCYNTASPARGSKTTTANDSDSDITRVGGETANIAYYGLQTASNLTTANSASLFTFSINDKGMGTEALSTTVTAISFEITNHQYLRTLALFNVDDGSSIAELVVTGNTVAFTGLTIVALDGSNKAVNVRATFLESVDDGEKIGLTISAVTAKASDSSTFAAGDGGGAATDPALNEIAVTATELVITAPELVKIGANFNLTVRAVDGKNNLDVADRSVTLSQTTGTGLSAGESLVQVATPGTFTWDAQAGSTAEDITVTVTDNSAPPLTAVSKDIEVVDELPEFTLAGTSLSDFGSVDNGATSTVQNFTVVGENLTDKITVRATDGFQVSLTEDSGFDASVELTPTGVTLTLTTIYVRFAPTSGTNGQVEGSIVLSTEDSATQTVEVTGTEAGNPAFTVTVSSSPIDFGSVDNGATSIDTDVQSFTVVGENLVSNITVTATESFEVSLDDRTFCTSVELTQTGGSVGDTTTPKLIYVRFAPASGTNGEVTANIVLLQNNTCRRSNGRSNWYRYRSSC